MAPVTTSTSTFIRCEACIDKPEYENRNINDICEVCNNTTFIKVDTLYEKVCKWFKNCFGYMCCVNNCQENPYENVYEYNY